MARALPKKRKSRYKTGIHVSKNGHEICYRSSWELYVCMWLDYDINVNLYWYEKIKIPYVSNIKTGKIRTYYPDFLVLYNDGSKLMIEVKRKNQVNNLLVQKKAEAAKQWCQQRNIKYEFWTDDKIKELRKIFPHVQALLTIKKKKKSPKKK